MPGWVPWLQGSVVPGLIGFLAVLSLIVAVFATIVLAIVKPDILTSFAVTSTKLRYLFIGILVLGITITGLGMFNLIRMRGDDRFKKPRTGIAVLVFALMIQISGFGITALGVDMQRNLVSSLFVDPAALADDSGVASKVSVPNLSGRLNILLLGGDAGENRWGLRPDSISVVNLDLATGRIVMIGIPRNLQKARFIEDSPMHKVFPDGFDCGNYCLINAIYTYATARPSLYSDPKYLSKDPGIEATREAVEGTLGITIDNYVLIDMMGFVRLVDAVGGVDINVPRRVVTQYGRVYEPGCQHMTGRQALLFARTRKDSNDYNRMSKQRIVQEAVIRQTSPLDLLRAYNEIANNGSQYIKTDLPENVVSDLLRAGIKAQKGTFDSLELVPPTVNTINPDISEIHAMVQDAITTGTAPDSPQGFASAAPSVDATRAPIAPGQEYVNTKPCS